MTLSPADLLAKVHCIICGAQIERFRLYCPNRRCPHEYERKLSMARNTRAYREYVEWNSYDLAHVTFEPYQSIDDTPA